MKKELMHPVNVPGFEDIVVSELREAKYLSNAYRQGRVQSASEAVAVFMDEFNRRVKFGFPGRHWTGSCVIHTGTGHLAFDDELLQALAGRKTPDGMNSDLKNADHYFSVNHPDIAKAIERAENSGRLLPRTYEAGISVGNVFSFSDSLRNSAYFKAAVPRVADSFPEFIDDAHRRGRKLTFGEGFALNPSYHSNPDEGQVSVWPLILKVQDFGKQTDFGLDCVNMVYANFPLSYRVVEDKPPVEDKKPTQRTLF